MLVPYRRSDRRSGSALGSRVDGTEPRPREGVHPQVTRSGTVVGDLPAGVDGTNDGVGGVVPLVRGVIGDGRLRQVDRVGATVRASDDDQTASRLAVADGVADDEAVVVAVVRALGTIGAGEHLAAAVPAVDGDVARRWDPSLGNLDGDAAQVLALGVPEEEVRAGTPAGANVDEVTATLGTNLEQVGAERPDRHRFPAGPPGPPLRVGQGKRSHLAR